LVQVIDECAPLGTAPVLGAILWHELSCKAARDARNAQRERDDHNTLMIYRIMNIEMAQLLADAALPGGAAAVFDRAMSTGVIKDEHKERTNRLPTSLKGRADSDKRACRKRQPKQTRVRAVSCW
jgi:hypothetical protein